MISIIIPCYNETKFISGCLKSVLEFAPIPDQEVEVLVLDGGSTDGTRGIVESFARGDHRVTLLENPKRIQSCALNVGIRASRGEWVMRLDAHTYYPPDYLSRCWETAQRTGADNVGGVCITYPGAASYQAQLVQALTTHIFGVGNSGFRTGANAGPRDTVPFGFFRKAVFERIGYFDERLVRTQDYELNRRLRAAGGMIFLDPTIRASYFNIAKMGSFLRKQLVTQGPYNAYMWYLAPYAFAGRHAATGCFAAFFWFGVGLSLYSSVLRVLFLAIMTVYATLALGATIQQTIRYRLARHILFLPACFFLFHLCHGTGVLAGMVRLIMGTSPVQKIREPWPGAAKFRAWPKE